MLKVCYAFIPLYMDRHFWQLLWKYASIFREEFILRRREGWRVRKYLFRGKVSYHVEIWSQKAWDRSCNSCLHLTLYSMVRCSRTVQVFHSRARVGESDYI